MLAKSKVLSHAGVRIPTFQIRTTGSLIHAVATQTAPLLSTVFFPCKCGNDIRVTLWCQPQRIRMAAQLLDGLCVYFLISQNIGRVA